jgi:hypothetical protein
MALTETDGLTGAQPSRTRCGSIGNRLIEKYRIS